MCHTLYMRHENENEKALNLEGENMNTNENGNATEKDCFLNAEGTIILKDVTSRILLTISFKEQLNGNYSKADFIFKNVMENASAVFDLDVEINKAKQKAILIITREMEEQREKQYKQNMSTQFLPM